MNFTRDLHLCGICKKIFGDLNFFLEHKSQCSSLHSSVVFSPNPHDISLENGLFSNETVLDLTVLDSGSFLPILHCENEEVVGDVSDFQPPSQFFQENSSDKDSADCLGSLLSDQSKSIIEKEAASAHANQISSKAQNNGFLTPELENKSTNSINSESISSNDNPRVENDPHKENICNKNAVHQSKNNMCKICNYVSAYHKDLVRHMRKHTGERPFICSVCDKRFARQDKLSIHTRIHIGDKRYKCQLCEYASTDSGALKKHSQIHTDERPHRCQMCSYRARNASHMTVHLRTHTGDSPFFCKFEGCGKAFKTSTDLKRHLKVHKLDPLSLSYSSFDGGTANYSCKHAQRNGKYFIKSTRCLICEDLTCKDVLKKKRGMYRKKSALVFCVQRHKCSICTASFVRQDSLRSHLKLHNLNTEQAQDSAEPEVNDSFKHPSEASISSTTFLSQNTANIDTSFL